MTVRLHPLLEQTDLDPYDLADALAAQRLKGHHIIDTVDELRRELFLQRLEQGGVHALLVHLRRC